MWLLVAIVGYFHFSFGQSIDNLYAISAKTVQQLAATTATVPNKIAGSTTKAIDQISRQQQKVYKQLLKVDSMAAADWLAQGKAITDKAKAQLNQATAGLGASYLPRLDSLQTMLGFLQRPGSAAESTPALKTILDQTRQLQNQLGNMEQLQQQLATQKAQLTQLLGKYTQLPKALLGQLKKYNGQLATYKAQVANWKATINQPEKLEREALKWLSKLPAFQQFMQQNSQLAQLFGSPAGAAGSGGQALAGLQTQQSVLALLQQRMGNGPQATQILQQNLQQGMAQLADVRNQATGLLQKAKQGTVGNAELTPYEQDKAALKSKTFLQHLQLGYNLQTATRIANFPSINDIGLSLGYKLNPRSVIGVGLAYKFGMGTWQKMRLTHEGVGLRSYVDWKITVSPQAKGWGNIWLSGGFEMNYWQRFSRLPNLRINQWQKSGLIGLSKKMTIRNKTASIQILYDFLRLKTSAGELPFVVRWGRGL